MVAAASAPATAPQAVRRPRVLFVDDDLDVLAAIAANLRRRYDVVTASSGAAGLELLETDPTIAVVVSDMRMPQLSGAQWLGQACAKGYDAVRMLLTGYSDVESAVEAVNQGHIFKFLSKPCPKAVLEAAVDAAIVQYELVIAERRLLEQTLHGSIKALVDVLALTSPGLFGRANRIKAHASQLAAAIEMRERWQVEVAAMVSHLGYIALPDALVAKLEAGHLLSEDERRMASKVPGITEQLLANIPRLEEVRGIIAAHEHPPPLEHVAGARRRLVALGAHVLHAATWLDRLETTVVADAAGKLPRNVEFDPIILAGLRTLEAMPRVVRVVRSVRINGLRVGMVFGEDVRLVSGAMLVARGYEVTAPFLQRVANMMPGALCEPMRVLVPE